MRHLFKVILLFTAGLLWGEFSSYGQENEYFIQFKTVPASMDEIVNHPDVLSFNCPFRLREMQNTYVLKLADSTSLKALKAEVLRDYEVNYIEAVPNYQLFYTPIANPVIML